jgi:hypothetical protein
MNRAVVLLTSVLAVAMAFVTQDWDTSAPGRLRNESRRRRGMTRQLAPAAVAEAPTPAQPETPVQPEQPVEPEKPAEPEIPDRIIEDPPLVIVDKADPLTWKTFNELHVGSEGELLWVSGFGKHEKEVDDLRALKKMLKQRLGRPNVVVAHPETVWQQAREVVLAVESNFQEDVYLAVALEDAPTKMMLVPFKQTGSPSLPLPEGDVFQIDIKGEPGEPAEYKVGGAVVESFPADVALAWNAWTSAHPDLKDTSEADETRVVISAHRFTAYEHVVKLVAVLRVLGIQTERIAGGRNMRNRK